MRKALSASAVAGLSRSAGCWLADSPGAGGSERGRSCAAPARARSGRPHRGSGAPRQESSLHARHGAPREAHRWGCVAPSPRTALLHCHHFDVPSRTSACSLLCLAMLFLVLDERTEARPRDVRRPYAGAGHARGIAGVGPSQKHHPNHEVNVRGTDSGGAAMAVLIGCQPRRTVRSPTFAVPGPGRRRSARPSSRPRGCGSGKYGSISF
jgi:hypothetical protein